MVCAGLAAAACVGCQATRPGTAPADDARVIADALRSPLLLIDPRAPDSAPDPHPLEHTVSQAETGVAVHGESPAPILYRELFDCQDSNGRLETGLAELVSALAEEREQRLQLENQLAALKALEQQTTLEDERVVQ